MNKPVALYYRILSYQPDNLNFLRHIFQLLELDDPRSDREDILAETEVLFAPLGFLVNEERMMRCPKLRVVVSNTTGVPHIDMEAAARRGIHVCALHDEAEFLSTITPTAEHTIGLMLAAWRRTPAAHEAAVSGLWNRRPWGAPKMFSRMRLGIVGFGRLGKKVGTIAQAMGMKTAFYDPHVPGGVANLKELASMSDILSLHAMATPETRGLISRDILEALPDEAMVVNTARGELLDEDALIDLLELGKIRAAALDTIDGEYNPDFLSTFSSSRIIVYASEHDNLILTPHIGGSTVDAWYETERFVIEKALGVLKGGS